MTSSRLFLFALLNTVGVNLALIVLAPGTSTTLHYVAAFLVGSAGQDSWEPMREALAYLHGGGGKPLYAAVFFDRGVVFQYPPTSLLFLEALRPLSSGGLPGNALLNGLAWIAVAGTAVVTARVFQRAASPAEGPSGAEVPGMGGGRGERTALALLAVCCTIAFYPIVKAFSLGQIQTWSTFLFAAAALAWTTGRTATAGVLSGLMCLLKPQLSLLLVWGLLRRHWAFVKGWAAVVIPVGLLSASVYGVANHWDYVRLLSFLSRHSWSYHPNQSVNGLLNRALFIGSNRVWDPHYLPFNAWVTAGTAISAVALVAGALFWRPTDARGAGTADFFIAGLTFTMASPLAWEHHYGVMMPMFAWALPAAWAVDAREAGPQAYGTDARRVPTGAWLALAFLLSSNLYEVTGWAADTRFNVVQSYLFAGACVLLACLYRLRRRQAGR